MTDHTTLNGGKGNVCVSIGERVVHVKGRHLFVINYLALLLVYFPNAQLRFSVDAYSQINNFDAASGHLILARLSSFAVVRLQELMGVDRVLDQQIFFYLYLACLSACVVVLFHCIFPLLNRGSILAALLLDIALLFSFANILIQEWSHFSEAYLGWGLGILSAAYAVKFFSYSGKKRYVFISFLFLLASLCFYQVNIQLFAIFGAFIVILENNFRFTRALFIGAVKLVVIAVLSALSNLLILKGLQRVSVAAVTFRDADTEHIAKNVGIITNLEINPLSNIAYVMIGMMVLICFVLFVVYVVVALTGGRRAGRRSALSGIALMVLFGGVGAVSTVGMHLVSSGDWSSPRTFVGIAFIISSLCVAIAYNIRSKVQRGGYY
jgi:hypothetical protein